MDYKKALQDMKENTPKTALEWYAREMFKTGFIQHLHFFDEIFGQAKQMEKNQIIEAHIDGQPIYSCQSEKAEKYYNETYKK